MMKTRVVRKKDGKYHPQYKVSFWWIPFRKESLLHSSKYLFIEEDIWFATLEEAKKFCLSQLVKPRPKEQQDEIVWSS